MIDKGYLILSHGNTYDFYEVPIPRGAHNNNDNNTSLGKVSDTDLPTAVNDMTDAVKNIPTEDREINNSENVINNESINIDFPSRIEAPKVKEIVISTPEAEGKKRPKASPPFVF